MNIVVVASRSRATFTSLQEMLGEDFDVQFAQSLPQVFEALAKRPTDLVFVDTRLSDCEGTEAIREITSVFPETCLIYLAPGEESRASAVSEQQGVYACLRKPLDRQIARFLAEKAIEKRKLSRRVEYLRSFAERIPDESFARPGDSLPTEYRGKAPASLGKGMVRKLLRSVSAVTDLKELLGKFADSVRELFGSNNVAIFIWDSDKGRYLAGTWQGVGEELAEVCSFSNRLGIVRWLIEHQQFLTRDKLRNVFPREPRDVAVEVSTDMDTLRAEVVMPLLERGNLIGFLTLGKKMTGKRYYEEDLELLAVIGDCASGAISTSLAHRELSIKKARAEAILNNIACGIVAVDAEARITSMNYFAESTFDVGSGELIGKSVQKLGSVLADMVLRTIKDDQPVANRPYRDGATGRVFAITTCRMYDERSNPVGAILFFTTLPETVPLVSPGAGGEGLREFVGLEGEMFAAFSAHIADKIKNPLASIKTFSQLLPEKFDDQEFRQKFSGIVGKAVERINSLADGLTSYAETAPLDLSPTNIAAVVDNAVAALRKSLGDRKLRVVAPGPDKPGTVLVDGRLMRSAFLNVLKNSVESTPPNGTITVSIKEVAARALRKARDGNASRVLLDSTEITGGDGTVPDDEIFVETEFRDSGKGIPEAKMGEVGAPFFTTRGENLGLGLAITRKIVGRHHGRIEIESKQGKGTTVWIILPREQNTP